MKCIIFVLLYVFGCGSLPVPDDDQSQENMKFFLYTDQNGDLQVEHLVDVPLDLNLTSKDMSFYYFSKSNPSRGIKIRTANIEAIRNTSFSAKKETLFIIHGWKNTFESDVNSHIREYILRDHDVNVFVVDWSPIAGKNYISAKASVKKVGGYVANFAKALQANYGLNLRSLKFVGHSLGAHVSGCAGAALDGQIDRIVGLDPAGPLFSNKNTDNRIDETDAIFVQIIHTNDGKLGYRGRLGDADYYPNGGKYQPGCGWDLTGSCSHSRAYELYAESLTSERFVSQKCDSYSEYTRGECDGDISEMGMFSVDTSARGGYYLETNSKSPYARG